MNCYIIGTSISPNHFTLHADADLLFTHRSPAEVHQFYTMLDPFDPKLFKSLNIFLRGEEILLGGAVSINPADMVD